MLDLFGKAILDYQTRNNPEPIITETTISEADEMSVDYLFRSFPEMPKIEQKAIQLSYGNILDVGCGAGSHSLHLQNLGHEVTAIDISPNAIKACSLRGVEHTKVCNLLEVEEENQFDTILLLMNGTGIFKTLAEAPTYLKKLSALLKEDGQILVDSSDIIYMFDQEDDGAYSVPEDNYYGELTFTIHYKKETELPFPWLYLDYNTLQNVCHDLALDCELVLEGDHYDYLAKIKKSKKI